MIAAAATSFLEAGIEVLGIFHGYTNLQDYDSVTHPMLAFEHYRPLAPADIRGIRNTRGIIIGTARVNPGAAIETPSDLLDPQKTERLARIHHALADLDVDALISIGGDDTLKTANFLYEYQRHHVAEENRIDYEITNRDPEVFAGTQTWEAPYVWRPGEEVGVYDCTVE